MNAVNNQADSICPVFYENGTDTVPINAQIYDAIIQKLSEYPFESGGILGKNEHGFITEFIFDRGMTCSQYEYVPDINALNVAIEAWVAKDISFCGIVHSHLQGDGSLSATDIEYANRIIRNFDCLNELHMPVVVIEPMNKVKMYFHVIRP